MHRRMSNPSFLGNIRQEQTQQCGGRHSCKHKWSSDQGSNPSTFTREGGRGRREQIYERERGGVLHAHGVTEIERFREQESVTEIARENTTQRWRPSTKIEVVNKTESCTQTWAKGGRRKTVEVEGEQEEWGGERDARWWRPEIGFTGELFIPAPCNRHDSEHWTVLKLARGTTQYSMSAAHCFGLASLDAARQLIYYWGAVRQRACMCGSEWVCMWVFMGPCSAWSFGSDHSSSHKMTLSRQELCVLVWICSPQ